MSTTIDTRRVVGRRKVKYSSFDALVADAERLSAGPVRSLGNWSLGQTLGHLGAAMEASIDSAPFQVPWWLRFLGIVYLKRKLVNGPFPPGFKLPRRAAAVLVAPAEMSNDEGLAVLRRGIKRLGEDSRRVAHPVAGSLTIDEWNRFHISHAEMHMSFLIPESSIK